MIPKRIITTWIADPKRDKYQERHREMFAHCLTSWLRLMPDYEIVIVTYGSVIESASFEGDLPHCQWVLERCKEGNFIGASQWARLWWLHRLGGFFLDADVEAVKRFDELRGETYVLGHLGNGQNFANNAVMGVEKGHPWLLDQLDYIQKCDPKHFDFGNETGPFMVSNLLRRGGWDGRDVDKTVIVPCENHKVRGGAVSVTVRRSKVFHPYSYNEHFTPECLAEDTLAIHHWAASWKPVEEQTQQVWR